MKLYRSLGRVWTGTQQDARTAQGNKDFETIEVPTDKPGLLAWLNTFDVRPGDAPDDSIGTADRYGADEPVIWTEDDIIPDPEARPVGRTQGDGNAPPVSATACPACARERRAATMVANAMGCICALGDLQDITEVESIDRLITAAQARRAALTTAAADPMGDILG